MPTQKIHPFVLCGGVGTRLWPLSRAGTAKQIVPVLEDETLLHKTVARIESSDFFATPTVIGSYNDRFILREQLADMGSAARIVVEPERRDTLAAVVLAAEIAATEDAEAIVAVLPADHLIDCPEIFAKTIRSAGQAISDGGIAVIGIKPFEPSDAYGYIRPAAEISDGVFKVAQFVEKPDVETAKHLIEDQLCLWNAGIFCFRAGWLIEAVRSIEPETAQAVRRSVQDGGEDLGFFVPSKSFAEARKISFDHGFMEKTSAAVVVPSDLVWSDLGDWKSVWSVADKDADGVAVIGDAITMDTRNTLIHASSRMVCTIGVDNLAVIETADAVLVVSLDSAQGVKGLVKLLEERERKEALEHLRCYRPWGWYQTTDLGERFRVKRIGVKPGAKLSLQRHHHRSEHWVVVRGTAEVTIGETVKKLHENESVYIPIGEVHRLSNPGRIPVELIEVQSGSYLEEDDIERLEDVFGRVEDMAAHKERLVG